MMAKMLQEYNFEHARRGKAVIICNMKFTIPDFSHSVRKGGETDICSLADTFRHLQFEVIEHRDLNTTEMLKVLLQGKECLIKKSLKQSLIPDIISMHELYHDKTHTKKTIFPHPLHKTKTESINLEILNMVNIWIAS